MSHFMVYYDIYRNISIHLYIVCILVCYSINAISLYYSIFTILYVKILCWNY